MFDDITPESIKRGILDNVGSGLETREGSFLDALVGPVAVELWKLYRGLDALVSIAYVDETSGGYIDLRCAEFGITRKEGTRARAVMAFTGKTGTTVPAGTAFATEDGLEFELLEGVTLTDGQGQGTAEAAAVGAAWNVAAGELSQMVLTLPGLETWTNAAAQGGTDPESDAALVGRLYDRLQRPATSGNMNHYDQWARSVEGVGAAKVLPLWDGPGTVKVLTAGTDLGQAADSIIAACRAYIQAQRPIGAAVTVESVAEVPVNVAASMVLDGSQTLGQVKAAFVERLGDFCLDQAEASIAQHRAWVSRQSEEGGTIDYAADTYTLRYNAVATMLMSIPGVVDYAGLTINGRAGNLVLTVFQMPVKGTVTLT